MDLDLTHAAFWVALGQIIWIDIVLSGDNAVVIALACRSLPDRQRKWGIILGAGTAIGLRIVFAVFIIYLLGVPWLKIIGGVLLLWIAIKLVIPEPEGHGEGAAAPTTLFAAIRTIAIADAVMSLDNVIAIAAASHGSVTLLVLGLLISIPLIVFGSTLILTIIDRFPVLIYAGAGLLGWISGHMILSDPAVIGWIGAEAAHGYELPAKIVGAASVIIVGYLLSRNVQERRRQAAATPSVSP